MTSLMARLAPLLGFVLVAGCTIEFVDHEDPRGGPAPDGRVPVPDATTQVDGYSPWPDGRSEPDAAGPADGAAHAVCGDRVVDVEHGEQCDTGSGASTADCDADCTLPACGDGFLNRAAGEACEPGMEGCTSACTYGAPAQLVPVLTGPEGAGGSALCSSVFGDEYACWRAFDASSSQWISEAFRGPAWVGYSWRDGPRTVVRYAILFANGSLTSRAPLDFTLEGFDGASWVAVDRRSGQRDWLGLERREYAVASPRSFEAYRLQIFDDNDDRDGLVVASIGRLELLGHR
jgi:hypothetical protein